MRATSANVCSANVNHSSQIEARRSGSSSRPGQDAEHECDDVQHRRVVERAELLKKTSKSIFGWERISDFATPAACKLFRVSAERFFVTAKNRRYSASCLLNSADIAAGIGVEH